MGEIVCETVAQYLEHGYTLTGWCIRCAAWRDIDLKKLAERIPHKPLATVRFRCGKCGWGPGQITVRPPDQVYRRARL